ncbi:hypothetical protein HKCCE2091_19760 [Rhodobacterales bacterium HKCCE2091]|nr:hypothetical protein [Rhodobacterales bacterium HKCCE2091]
MPETRSTDRPAAAPLTLGRDMRSTPPPMPAETARRIEAMLPDLRREARRLTPSWSAADDLVQETFLKLWARVADLGRDTVHEVRAVAFELMRHLASARAGSSRDLETAPPAEPRSSLGAPMRAVPPAE